MAERETGAAAAGGKLAAEKVRALLEILQEDDRADPAEIAVMLEMTEDQVRKEIAALEKARIIVKYRAMVNWEKTEIDMVSALIEVKVTPQRDVGFDDVARRIYLFPEVRSVYLMSGAYDLCVQVTAPNLKELARFVSEKLATLENVTSTATHFVLKRYKQEGVLFEDEERQERLAISP
ncbi:MAG: Lrp/AsnC family transcriptional regulator [Patescibacteria group bacterium]